MLCLHTNFLEYTDTFLFGQCLHFLWLAKIILCTHMISCANTEFSCVSLCQKFIFIWGYFLDKNMLGIYYYQKKKHLKWNKHSKNVYVNHGCYVWSDSADHQRWLVIALVRSANPAQSFFFIFLNSFFLIDLVTCQISYSCFSLFLSCMNLAMNARWSVASRSTWNCSLSSSSRLLTHPAFSDATELPASDTWIKFDTTILLVFWPIIL